MVVLSALPYFNFLIEQRAFMINTKVCISLTSYRNMERRSLKLSVCFYVYPNVKLFIFQKKTFNVARYETKHL